MGKTAQGLIVVAVLGIGGYLGYRLLRPSPFPNLTLVANNEPARLAELSVGKKKLVLALLLPGDAMSKAACLKLKNAYEAHETKVAFAAVLISNEDAATKFREENDLPFPVYALEPQSNPIEYHAMVKAVGGFRNRFYGGTVLVLNPWLGIIGQVNGDELTELDDKLARL